MRHVLSLLFGILLAPLIWFLASLGHYRFLDALRRFGEDPDRLRTELAFGALLIVAAGVWLGVLLGTRLSPVGPGIAGIAWLSVGAFFILDVQRVVDLLPEGPSGKEDLYVLPLDHAYAFLVGAALLVPLFNPSRWRSRSDAAAGSRYGAASVSAPPAGVGATTARNDRVESDPRHDAPNRYRRDTAPTYRESPTGGQRPIPYRESPTGGQRPVPYREDPTGGQRPVPFRESPTGGQRPVPYRESPTGGQRPVPYRENPTGQRERPSAFRETPTGYGTPVYPDNPPSHRETAQPYGTERRWAESTPSEVWPGEGRGAEPRLPWEEQPARRRTNDR